MGRRHLPDLAAGVALVAALALHAWSKGDGRYDEMLWLCHVATLVMAIGFLSGTRTLVAAGFLLHAGFGFWVYLLDAVETGETTPTSVLVHVLPLVAGGIAIARRGWPRGVLLPAWAFYCAIVPLSYWLADPALNVNLCRAPWPPIAGVLPQIWVTWLLNAALMLAMFGLAQLVITRWIARREVLS